MAKLILATQAVSVGYHVRTAGHIAQETNGAVLLYTKTLQANPLSGYCNLNIEVASQTAMLITANQAVKFGEEIGIAGSMAQASNCMVHIDPHKLQAYPVSDEFNALIEAVGPNDVDYADVINLTAPTSAKNIA